MHNHEVRQRLVVRLVSVVVFEGDLVGGGDSGALAASLVRRLAVGAERLGPLDPPRSHPRLVAALLLYRELELPELVLDLVAVRHIVDVQAPKFVERFHRLVHGLLVYSRLTFAQ
jgi:hypothetical protein